MAIVVASAHQSDEEFLAGLSNCELPLSCFRHGDHLRLAWIEVHRCSPEQAVAAVAACIRQYAAHHGVSHIFHVTMTTAWVKLVATHTEATFAQFLADNEHRLNPELLHRFWTPAALSSDTARRTWLPPDKEALPA